MQNIVDILKTNDIIRLTKNSPTMSQPVYSGTDRIMKNLKLKIARMEMGISQIQLAEMAGVTRQTIGMIEAGDFNPSLRLCIDICKSLNKTLDELFWEEEVK